MRPSRPKAKTGRSQPSPATPALTRQKMSENQPPLAGGSAPSYAKATKSSGTGGMSGKSSADLQKEEVVSPTQPPSPPSPALAPHGGGATSRHITHEQLASPLSENSYAILGTFPTAEEENNADTEVSQIGAKMNPTMMTTDAAEGASELKQPAPPPSAFIPPDPGPDMPIPSEPDPGSVSVAASAAISTAIASLNPAAHIMFETSNDLAPDPFFLSNEFSVLPTLLTT